MTWRFLSVVAAILLNLLFALGWPCEAAGQKEIQDAIKRGVEFLKGEQDKSGAWKDHEALGATALATLALIESGVDLGHESVSKGLKFVRAQAPKSTHTYSVALAIMVLDRAGDRYDRPLIRAMGERLCHGQNQNGSWTYWIPSQSSATEYARRVANMAQLGDNSNTQFAVLGLWVARRHEARVDEALQKVAQHFRNTVSKADVGSGWPYVGTRGVTPSMTCAGLIALATRHGVHALRAERGLARRAEPGAGNSGKNADLNEDNRKVQRDPEALKDPLVTEGLKYLESYLERGLDHDWYFHWSLERVAVIFDLPRIGNVDWYKWSSEIALKNQAADGSWRHQWGAVPETAFVLLVLNRANVAGDLTRIVGTGQSQLTAASDVADLKKRVQAAIPSEDVGSDDPAPVFEKLMRAAPAQQRKLLEEIRDKKGAEYSTLLVSAIDRLAGDVQAEAREFLVQRFGRLTAKSLRVKLSDSSPEARSAAIQAAERKGLRELVPDIIDRLTDTDLLVGQRAVGTLRKLTNEDFGPANPNASLAERFTAKKRWKNWASEQSFGSP